MTRPPSSSPTLRCREWERCEFASALMIWQLTKSLPVILMSATARPMIPPGIHAFLEKPLKIEPLLAAIRGAARLAPSHLN